MSKAILQEKIINTMTILSISDHNYIKYKWIKFCNQKTEDEEWVIKQKPKEPIKLTEINIGKRSVVCC